VRVVTVNKRDIQAKLLILMKGPTGRYVLVGGSIYMVELLSIIIMQYFGVSALLAVAFSFCIGLVLSFGLQKYIAFQDKRSNKRIVLSQAIAFTLLVIFNFSFTLLVTKILIHILPTVVNRTLALGATTIWNFYIYKTHIFKGNNAPLID
jgi:putative flippase GtrA